MNEITIENDDSFNGGGTETGGANSENDEHNNSDSSLSNDNQCFKKNSNRKSMNRRKQLKPNRISSMQLAALQQKKQKEEEQQQQLNGNNLIRIMNIKERSLKINNDLQVEEGEVNDEEEGQEINDADEADSSSILKLKQKSSPSLSPTLTNSQFEPGVITATTPPDSEASYCNLCKKGFCNKYFLKSHMSNKHGGLFEPTSTVYLGSTGSMITHFKYASPKKQSQHHQTDTEFTQDKFKLNENLTENELTNGKQQQQQQVQHGAENNQDTTLQTLLTEDYCDSCQKHFCNKYYLRKHKLDVHGIVIDNNIKPYKKHDKTNRLINKSLDSTGKTENKSPETTFSSLLVKTNSTESNPLEIEQKSYNSKRYGDHKPRSSTPQPISNNQQNGASSETLSPSPILNQTQSLAHNDSSTLPPHFGVPNPNFMLVNPYMMQFPHLFAKHAAAVAASLNGASNAAAQTDLITPLVLQNQLALNNSQLAKSLLPPANFDLFLNKMNSIQQQPVVISPSPPPSSQNSKNEEFVNCNLCSKSFCSVDFLKLHLINKHGINDEPVQQTKKVKQESGDSNEIRYELKLHDSNAINTETFCFICEKDFSNKSLLKSHINQKHSQTSANQQKSLMNENELEQQFKSFNDDLNQMNNSAGKCLDKVVCNICNKQLCNKYFLRTHKAKVHGIKYELINGLSILSANAESPNGSQSSNTIDGDDRETTSSRKRKHDEENDDNDIDESANEDGQQHQSQDIVSQVDEDEKENKDVKINNNKQSIVAPLPTSYLKAYCELCNKELCNKYFLKSHMLNTHNINIDDNEPQIDMETAAATAAAATVSSVNRRFVMQKKQQKIKNTIEPQKNEIETKYSTKTDNSVLLDSPQKIFNELYRSCLPSTIQTQTNGTEVQNSSKFDMQPFLIESQEKRFNENFVPCLVYLPVKNRIQSTIQLQLQLKPLDQTNLAQAMTNDNSSETEPLNGKKRQFRTQSTSSNDTNSPLIIDTNDQLNDNSTSNEDRINYLQTPISSS